MRVGLTRVAGASQSLLTAVIIHVITCAARQEALHLRLQAVVGDDVMMDDGVRPPPLPRLRVVLWEYSTSTLPSLLVSVREASCRRLIPGPTRT